MVFVGGTSAKRYRSATAADTQASMPSRCRNHSGVTQLVHVPSVAQAIVTTMIYILDPPTGTIMVLEDSYRYRAYRCDCMLGFCSIFGASRPEFGFWANINDASTWLCSFSNALVCVARQQVDRVRIVRKKAELNAAQIKA